MCIAYLALGVNPQWPVFIAANRDEYRARPSLTAAPWKNHPDLISGIDLKAGGTWLGVTRQGRFGLLTNYREPGKQIDPAPSRGALVSDYLLSPDSHPHAYAAAVSDTAQNYNGFNLIVGDQHEVWYVGNRTGQAGPRSLPAGRYVLSNHLLDTPWPKAERLRQSLGQFPLGDLPAGLGQVFSMLKDDTPADDKMLPRTGLSPEQERMLSSPFVRGAEYGTRCSTIVAMARDGRALLSEATYDACAKMKERHDWPFRMTA